KDDLRASFADHFSAEHFGGYRCGFFFRLGDDDAFSGRQPVCFDDYWRMKVWKRRANFVDRPANHVVRRGYVVALHELLGEALARLKLRGHPGRTERPPATTSELVHRSQ